MPKNIYLPAGARKQLSTSDDSRVWAKPIPYRHEPERGFTLEVAIKDKELDNYHPLEHGFFYPDRTEPDAILERMHPVKLRAKAKDEPQSPLEARVNAVYRCFEGVGRDSEVWAKYDGQQVEILLAQSFSIHAPMSYFRRREEAFDRILREGAGIVINRVDIQDWPDNDNYESPRSKVFRFTPDDQPSSNGKTYKIVQWRDNGARGMAVLMVQDGKKRKVLYADHNDNVRDCMQSSGFLKEAGIKINLKWLSRENQISMATYSKYRPTPDDFKRDFDVDEKGKKTKA